MSTELAPRQPLPMLRGEELDDAFRLAKALALSRRFPDARTAEEALAKILVGRDLGLGATQAMTGIHIVEGRPQVAAVTLASFVRQSGNYDYRVRVHTDEECSIEFGHGDAPGRDGEGEWLPWPGALGISTFTMDNARAAGLVKDKSGWVKYPRNMLFARAMSNGVKWYCPDTTNGISVYHEGEIEGGWVDGQPGGEVVEAPGQEVVQEVAAAIADEDLRERFLAAYKEAQDVLPGRYTPAAVQMSLKDQPPETAAVYVADMEAAVEATKPPEAETVDTDVPIDTEGLPSVENIDQGQDLEGMRRQLSDLYDRLADHDADADADPEKGERLNAEIKDMEQQLQAAGGSVPGQEQA